MSQNPPPAPTPVRIKVACTQSNCAYFCAIDGPEKATHCECSHPEKRHYLHSRPCPLFRLNWMKVNTGSERAMEIIRAKRGSMPGKG
jgi:hypothetical protein